MYEKIAVIGAGNVGATLVQRLAEAELAKVVAVVDIVEGVPQGKAQDLLQSGPECGYDTKVIGGNTYEIIEGAKLVVVTAGLPRKPGMSRDDLLETNAKIVADVSRNIKQYAPDSMVIVVSNPLDAMCHVALEVTGFPPERVLGMAGVLDRSRFAAFIADALNVSVNDVYASVLGGHGDSMVPLTRYSTVAGIPLTEWFKHDPDKLQALVDRTRNGGAEIVAHLKTGSAFYAPSASVLAMVESIVKDKKRILPCAAYLQGEYDVNGLYVGVPCKLGKNGLEEILKLDLSSDEREALNVSIDDVRANVEKLHAGVLSKAGV